MVRTGQRSRKRPARNSRRRAQGPKAAAFAFARVFIGVLWLFEVTVGHNWKIGGLASGRNPAWFGTGAGDQIREDTAQAVADGTWSWFAWFAENMFAPNAEVLSYLVVGVQVLFGVAFILGFLVRPIAALALVFDLSVFMLGNSRIPPFFSAMHIFLLVSNAGMYYGLDGWLAKRREGKQTGGARGLRVLTDLPLFKEHHRVLWTAGASLAALYFFLQIPVRQTGRMQMVALDLAVLFALVAIGLYAAARIPDRMSVAAAGIRVFVGYKLLHEIWVRTDPGVNALPGFASSESMKELFGTISDNHWALFGWIADQIFIPAMPAWVVVFGATQLAVGVLLVVGYRTREASILGAVYLGGLIIMGMTRYAPFVLGLLIVALALDSGRTVSLDAALAKRKILPPSFGLPVPVRLVPVLSVLAAVNAVAAAGTAFRSGITPDAYVGSMGAMTTAMVAIFSGLLALGGWLQGREPQALKPVAGVGKAA